MIKKFLVLVMVMSMISIYQSTSAKPAIAESKSDRRTDAISTGNSTEPAKERGIAPIRKTLKQVDPFKIEYISGGMDALPNAYFMLSVLNSSDKRDGYVEVEVHVSWKPGNKNTGDPIIVKNIQTTKIKPGTLFTLVHKTGDDRMRVVYDAEYWFKIKASSEFLIPKIVMHYSPDNRKVSQIRAVYLPGDFAVFSRDPYKRIR